MIWNLYRVTCSVDGMTYHGAATNLRKRWREHLNDSSNRHLREAIKLHGVEAFKFEALAFGDRKTVLAMERARIEEIGYWPASYNLRAARARAPDGCVYMAKKLVKGGLSFRATSRRLAEYGYKTAGGKEYCATSISNMLTF